MNDLFEFQQRLDRLIARVEAWSYADSDSDTGTGLPVEVASELRALVAAAPTPSLTGGVRRAQDALDDGLSAEAVAAELYALRAELGGGGNQVSPPPSPSR